MIQLNLGYLSFLILSPTKTPDDHTAIVISIKTIIVFPILSLLVVLLLTTRRQRLPVGANR
jgi:hypothetical protein